MSSALGWFVFGEGSSGFTQASITLSMLSARGDQESFVLVVSTRAGGSGFWKSGRATVEGLTGERESVRWGCDGWYMSTGVSWFEFTRDWGCCGGGGETAVGAGGEIDGVIPGIGSGGKPGGI